MFKMTDTMIEVVFPTGEELKVHYLHDLDTGDITFTAIGKLKKHFSTLRDIGTLLVACGSDMCNESLKVPEGGKS